MGLVLIIKGSTGHDTSIQMADPPSVDETKMNKISSIYEAIKSIGEIDYADPDLYIALPFPSLHPLPASFSRDIADGEDIERLRYMGRERFTQLYETVRNEDIQRGTNRLYLYGASGTGKSHLLAALVCQLVFEGERVFYIPDCRRILQSHTFIRDALLFAFQQDPHLWATISTAKTMDALLELPDILPERSFYVVVDQFDALEIQDLTDNMSGQKWDMTTLLNRIGSGQKFIYSASANGQSTRDAIRKQSNVRSFCFLSGLNKVWSHPCSVSHLTMPRLSWTNGGSATRSIYRISIKTPASGSRTLLVAFHFYFGRCSDSKAKSSMKPTLSKTNF